MIAGCGGGGSGVAGSGGGGGGSGGGGCAISVSGSGVSGGGGSGGCRGGGVSACWSGGEGSGAVCSKTNWIGDSAGVGGGKGGLIKNNKPHNTAACARIDTLSGRAPATGRTTDWIAARPERCDRRDRSLDGVRDLPTLECYNVSRASIIARTPPPWKGAASGARTLPHATRMRTSA